MALETVEIDNGPRLVSPEPEPEDFDSEASLRPKNVGGVHRPGQKQRKT